MNIETKKYLEQEIEKKLGIKYEDYINLDYGEQRKLICDYYKKLKSKNDKKVTVMIGSGIGSSVTKVDKGTRIMVGSGVGSCFVRAGITPEESRRELDDRIDEAIYSKPVVIVKKLKRRLTK